MSDETWDDAPCTDCGDTGITYQTERVCSCLAGLAIEMIDADACPSPADRISSLESQLLASERERDALREALTKIDAMNGWDGEEMQQVARAALTANHSAPVVEE